MIKLVKRFLVFSVGLVFILGVTFSYLAYRTLNSPVELSSSHMDFNIPSGSSFRRITERLYARGVLDSPWPLMIYGRFSGKSAQLKAGEYRLDNGQTPLEILARFIKGRSIQHAFTIVEGWSLKELLVALEQEEKLMHVLEVSPGSQLQQALGFELESAEGLFFADTYHFSRSDTDLSLLKRAYVRMQKVLADEWQKRPKGLPYKRQYEALIMASIVEKETGLAEERAEIAGVFVRRIKKKMRLQTDPTVIYGLGESYNGNLTRKDLKTRTPYNTYVISGLPPTPIAMAGREAIHASLHPKEGDSLYFVAKGNGSHYFSSSLKAHNNAVKKYQWKRRSDYRSTPQR
ncbi:MAG: endolytic transglycosylase MltG [Pseudomonadales bacterium]|nr:endolytic transglycosylase MltG [Pseudomonadales bacterium]